MCRGAVKSCSHTVSHNSTLMSLQQMHKIAVNDWISIKQDEVHSHSLKKNQYSDSL